MGKQVIFLHSSLTQVTEDKAIWGIYLNNAYNEVLGEENVVFVAAADMFLHNRDLYTELVNSRYQLFTYTADTERYGKEAYLIRNRNMLSFLQESDKVIVLYHEGLVERSDLLNELQDTNSVLVDISTINKESQLCLF